jgi:hypothetical protein
MLTSSQKNILREHATWRTASPRRVYYPFPRRRSLYLRQTNGAATIRTFLSKLPTCYSFGRENRKKRSGVTAPALVGSVRRDPRNG